MADAEDLVCFGVNLTQHTILEAAENAGELEAEFQRRQEDRDLVQMDRSRGVKHVAKMQQIVSGQQAMFNRICKTIQDEDEEQILVRTGHDHDRRTKSPYPYDEVKLLTKTGMFNPSRMHNACNVANTIAYKKVRQEKVQRRRKQCVHDERARKEAMTEAHETADRCAVQRQREMHEKQAARTAAAHQKHGQQIRILHEIHKSQDQEFEKLQLKHHPSTCSSVKPTVHNVAKKTQAADESPSNTQSRPSTSPTQSLEAKERARQLSDEQVSRNQLQSHNLYDKTLSKMKSYVADNERRTEVYWSKMYEGGKDAHERKRRQLAASGSPTGRSPVDVSSVRRLLTKSFSTNLDGLDATLQPGSPINADWNDDWNVEGFDSTLTSPNISKVLSSSPASPEQYAAKLERCKTHQMVLHEAALQKSDQNQKFLEDKRRRGKNELNQRANRAKDSNMAWQQRNDDSAQRREQLSEVNDAEVVEKLARTLQKQEEMQSQRDEDLSASAFTRRKKAQQTQEAARDRLEDSIRGFEVKREAGDKQGAMLLKLKMEHLEVRADSGIAEKSEAMLSHKAANHVALQRSVTAGLDKKQKRNEHAKYLVMKPKDSAQAFERYRYLRQENGDPRARATPPELTLVHWELPLDESPLEILCRATHSKDKIFFRASSSGLSGRASNSGPTGATSSDSSPTAGMMYITEGTPKAGQSPQASPKSPAIIEHSQNFKATMSSDLDVLVRKGSNLNAPDEANPDSTPSSDDEGHDTPVESESEFIHQLEDRTHTWLTEMRRDREKL